MATMLIIGKATTAAGYAGQANSFGNGKQTGVSTTAGYASITASYAGTVANSASYSKIGSQFGKLGGSLSLLQVGINYADNNGDYRKLTAGDVLNVLGAVTTLTPGLQPVGVVLTGLGVAYS